MPKATRWEVLVVKFDCRCEDHYRRRPGSKGFAYFDSSVSSDCTFGGPSKANCISSYEDSLLVAKLESEK